MFPFVFIAAQIVACTAVVTGSKVRNVINSRNQEARKDEISKAYDLMFPTDGRETVEIK